MPPSINRRNLLVLLLASTAAAAPVSPIDALTRLFQAPAANPDWFDANFIAHVPIEQVDAILATVKQQYGAFKNCTGSGRDYVVHLAQGDVSARIVLDANGLISGLLIRPMTAGSLDQPVPGSLQDHINAIASLPGKTALLVTTNGRALASINADMPLAVGSAFKLAVLKAVRDACDAGRMSWDRNIALDAAHRSLPSGILQNSAPGTEMTVRNLANLMISISDNTAADTLLAAVGRPAVETISPRNTPFLATRELFILKAKENAGLREKFLAGDSAARRILLPTIDAQTLPAVDGVTMTPTPGLEWFFSALELQTLLEQVGTLPAFDANPGVARRADWQHTAFKGGSDAGVMNLSTLLVAHDGTRHSVIATWNDTSPLDEMRLMKAYQGILQRLAGGVG
jgi:beta-lactamase class A